MENHVRPTTSSLSFGMTFRIEAALPRRFSRRTVRKPDVGWTSDWWHSFTQKTCLSTVNVSFLGRPFFFETGFLSVAADSTRSNGKTNRTVLLKFYNDPMDTCVTSETDYQANEKPMPEEMTRDFQVNLEPR